MTEHLQTWPKYLAKQNNKKDKLGNTEKRSYLLLRNFNLILT